MKGITWRCESARIEQNYDGMHRVDVEMSGYTDSIGLSTLRNYDSIRLTVENALNGSRTPFKIEKVIFNNPATIILWTDGSKTVVKCQPGDIYSKEVGFITAYLKKLLGNDNTFNKEINKWVPEERTFTCFAKLPGLDSVTFNISEEDMKAITDELKLAGLRSIGSVDEMHTVQADPQFTACFEALKKFHEDNGYVIEPVVIKDEAEPCDVCRHEFRVHDILKKYITRNGKRIRYTHCPFCGRKLKTEEK